MNGNRNLADVTRDSSYIRLEIRDLTVLGLIPSYAANFQARRFYPCQTFLIGFQ